MKLFEVIKFTNLFIYKIWLGKKVSYLGNEEMMYLDGGLNMFKLSDKVRLIFALLGVSSILVSMYLIPFIKTENKFWEILLFILGVLLIGIALLNPPKN